MCCEEDFIKELRERGFRLTPQREMVLKVMHQTEGHVTADEIHSRVQDISSCVDMSTVYRTLELLQEFHFVASLDLGDGQRRYALLSMHGLHHHLFCRSCGKLIQVEQEDIRPLLDHLLDTYGFVAELDHLIPGVFQGCEVTRDEAPEAGSGVA